MLFNMSTLRCNITETIRLPDQSNPSCLSMTSWMTSQRILDMNINYFLSYPNPLSLWHLHTTCWATIYVGLNVHGLHGGPLFSAPLCSSHQNFFCFNLKWRKINAVANTRYKFLFDRQAAGLRRNGIYTAYIAPHDENGRGFMAYCAALSSDAPLQPLVSCVAKCFSSLNAASEAGDFAVK